MSLEYKVRESLQEEARGIVPSPELKEKVMNQMKVKHGGKSMKKRLITGVLAATLLIPTSAFAYQSLVADGVYGSFDNVKKHFSNATLQGYMHVNAKLSQAKGEMGEKEYKEFTTLLKGLLDTKMKYGDANGNIDYDQLSQEKQEEMMKASMVIQPYFDKLNGEKSSKEVLTPEEFKQYIHAQMTYEKIQAKMKSSEPITIDEVPEKYKVEFQEADHFMNYVSEKVQK
ncbi:DUF3600 domain-containing protein [Bacillus sp. WLY-B-L8]|uniref:DUF3600 domain-containing protein n=1 Tax=Bacillus multifaciens TaxID=3068506 RepID=UPI002740838C|nr:DUF3600 domain-containing protein [Bacillus sp. WLY-B-L8]MDP7977871.1 DUF3600 domain-containing protein [Bacillus sp. WLY-B-L8]